ncbi:MAG: M20/M25/M40 family metallo-hydrolase [Halieaceae bacterium]|jgi:acetylornithine deacetylase/succinyl-diaminopimelate desuccinylase-like protein|nr:M20/M25/M40 family metallo-hydrolase [Halieaceae bacterium]
MTRRRVLQSAVVAAGSLPLLTPIGAGAAALGAEEALAMAEARRDELLELLSRLVRIRSLSGESGDVAQGVVMDYLAALPYAVEESRDRPSDYIDHPEYMPPSPAGDGPFSNVVARPTNGGSRYALFAHIDTHRVEEGWVSDPFEPVVRGSRLYGLGVGDDKGGIAAMLVAAAALSDHAGLAPIVISSHGKGGGSRGSLPVFQRMGEAGEGIDAMLYIHPAETGRGLADIKHAVRGVLDFRVEVEGWQGTPLEIGLPDSALWRDGGNALTYLGGLLEHLRAGPLAAVEVNVGRLQAGERPGAVPSSARADLRLLFDSRFTWRELLASVRREIASYVADPAKGGSRYTVRAESLGRHSNAGEVSWDAPSTLGLRSAIESVKGRAPQSYPNHYGGDIRYPLRLLDAPSFGIGSLGGNFYGPNEWIDIDDLVKLVAVVILTLSNWNAAGVA